MVADAVAAQSEEDETVEEGSVHVEEDTISDVAGREALTPEADAFSRHC